MFKIVANWFMSAIALYIVSRLVPGIMLGSFTAALVAVLIIGLINALLKPILILLTLPATILTLGLFTFVVNALLFLLAGSVTTGFQVNGFGAALVGSILLSVVSTLLHSLVR